MSGARHTPPGHSLARPRRAADAVVRAGELYAGARRALERGAWREATATLEQAGQWLSAWEVGEGRLPPEAGSAGLDLAVAGARDQLTRLRRSLAEKLERIAADRVRVREQRRTLRRFGSRSAGAGHWLDQSG